MTEKSDKPLAGKQPDRRAAVREARLKLALKANMARRKAQASVRANARGLDDEPSGAGSDDTSDSEKE